MIDSTPQTFFDSDYYLAVNAARDAVFQQFLPALATRLALRSALDVGCGLGYYSDYLIRLGLQVTGIDGRKENVEVARQRCPSARFIVSDVDRLASVELETFDMVFCAGLLYHLESPFSVIRQLRSLCRSVCVIESRVYWTDLPNALLVREPDNPTQALARYAWVLSRRSMITMLYAAGFERVYSVRYSSQHEELRRYRWRAPRRHFLVASLNPIELAHLQWEENTLADDVQSSDMYARSWLRCVRTIRDAFGWLGF